MGEWLDARGFERRDAIPRWPCDDELERGLFLFENDDWVVLLYSGIDGEVEEDNRLLIHLGRLGRPMLYVYGLAHLWGYRIHEGRDVLDAYSSMRDHSFVEWLTEHPTYGDLKFLADVFDLSVSRRVLEHVRGSPVMAREGIFGRFCDALGVAPAGVGYAQVERRYLDERPPESIAGWRVERGYWAKRGFAPSTSGAGLKLHEIPPRKQHSQRYGAWWPTFGEIGPPGGGMVGVLRLFALIGAALRVVGWVIGGIFTSALWADRLYRLMGWDQRSSHAGEFERALMAGARPLFSQRNDGLRSEAFGCEMRLPAGAKLLDEAGPGACAIRLPKTIVRGKAEVWCDVVRAEADAHVRQLFRYPDHFEVVADDAIAVDGGRVPARVVAWEMNEPNLPYLFVTHGVVQISGAFLVLSASVRKDADRQGLESAVRAMIESFSVTRADYAGVNAGKSAEAAAGSTAS
jgi:hypothetical protein